MIIKFQYFPGFPGCVQTLILRSCLTVRSVLRGPWGGWILRRPPVCRRTFLSTPALLLGGFLAGCWVCAIAFHCRLLCILCCIVLCSENKTNSIDVVLWNCSITKWMPTCRVGDLTRVTCDKIVPTKMNLVIYQIVIRLTLLYGSETWPMSVKDEKPVVTTETGMVRWAMGVSLLEVWNIGEIRRSWRKQGSNRWWCWW